MRGGSLSRLGTTIYGLASAVSNQSAVTVYKISGPNSFQVVEDLTGSSLKSVKNPAANSCRVMSLFFSSSSSDTNTNKSFLDEALVLWFRGPRSSTGEDVVELHTHGGHETARVMMRALGNLSYLHAAEPVIHRLCRESSVSGQ